MKKFSVLTMGFLVLEALTISSAAAQSNQCNWAGNWETSRGTVNFSQIGTTITGTSAEFGDVTAISYRGKKWCELYGVFRDSKTQKQGEFKLLQNGDSFTGQWQTHRGRAWAHSWIGERSKSVIEAIQADRIIGLADGTNTLKITGPLQQVPTPSTQQVGKPPEIMSTLPNKSIQTVGRLNFAVSEGTSKPAPASQLTQLATKGTWTVTLDSLCAPRSKPFIEVRSKTLGKTIHVAGAKLNGMAWVRARLIDKNTGKQVVLSPDEGFPRVSGDKERAWEVAQGRNQFYVENKRCRTLNVAQSYTIDAKAYGYNSMAELLENEKNRIDVQVKLGHVGEVYNSELGVKRAATSLAASNFCGNCKQSQTLPNKVRGNGVLTGFRDQNNDIRAYYSIKSVTH